MEEKNEKDIPFLKNLALNPNERTSPQLSANFFKVVLGEREIVDLITERERNNNEGCTVSCIQATYALITIWAVFFFFKPEILHIRRTFSMGPNLSFF